MNNTDDWLTEYKKSLPLWERMLDKIPVIRRLRWIDRYCHDVKLMVKSWWQRRTKGFAHEETWSLGYTTAKWILPRLKYFRNNLHSVPPNLEKGYDTKEHSMELNSVDSEERFSLTLDEWKDKLDKMIYAFEFILTEDDIVEKCYPADFNWGFKFGPEDEMKACELIFFDTRKPDYTYYEECQARHVEGMKLFTLYYRHLWD